MESVDTITDLVSQPVVADFGPGMLGVVHAGIIQAAKATLDNVFDIVQQAAAKNPDLDLLVVGECGGGPRMHARVGAAGGGPDPGPGAAGRG